MRLKPLSCNPQATIVTVKILQTIFLMPEKSGCQDKLVGRASVGKGAGKKNSRDSSPSSRDQTIEGGEEAKVLPTSFTTDEILSLLANKLQGLKEDYPKAVTHSSTLDMVPVRLQEQEDVSSPSLESIVAKLILLESGLSIDDAAMHAAIEKAILIKSAVARCVRTGLQFSNNTFPLKTLASDLNQQFVDILSEIILIRVKEAKKNKEELFLDLVYTLGEVFHGVTAEEMRYVIQAEFDLRIDHLLNYAEEENAYSNVKREILRHALTVLIFLSVLSFLTFVCIAFAAASSTTAVMTIPYLMSSIFLQGAVKLAAIFCFALSSGLANVLSPRLYPKVKDKFYIDTSLQIKCQNLRSEIQSESKLSQYMGHVRGLQENVKTDARFSKMIYDRKKEAEILAQPHPVKKGVVDFFNLEKRLRTHYKINESVSSESLLQPRSPKKSIENLEGKNKSVTTFRKQYDGYVAHFLTHEDSFFCDADIYIKLHNIGLHLNIEFMDGIVKSDFQKKERQLGAIAGSVNELLNLLQTEDISSLLNRQLDIEKKFQQLAQQAKEEGAISSRLLFSWHILRAMLLGLAAAASLYFFLIFCAWMVPAVGGALTFNAFLTSCVNGSMALVGGGIGTTASVCGGTFIVQIYHYFEERSPMTALQKAIDDFERLTNRCLSDLSSQYQKIIPYRYLIQQQLNSPVGGAELMPQTTNQHTETLSSSSSSSSVPESSAHSSATTTSSSSTTVNTNNSSNSSNNSSNTKRSSVVIPSSFYGGSSALPSPRDSALIPGPSLILVRN